MLLLQKTHKRQRKGGILGGRKGEIERGGMEQGKREREIEGGKERQRGGEGEGEGRTNGGRMGP